MDNDEFLTIHARKKAEDYWFETKAIDNDNAPTVCCLYLENGKILEYRKCTINPKGRMVTRGEPDRLETTVLLEFDLDEVIEEKLYQANLVKNLPPI